MQQAYAQRRSAFDPVAVGPAPATALDVRTIYREHGRFVWLSLQRLGIHPSDLDDIAQDVFMVVHRRLDTFDRRARVSTWLFGICMRVAANYRRRRRWTREVLSGGFEDDRPAARSEEHTSELQSLRHLVCRLLLE